MRRRPERMPPPTGTGNDDGSTTTLATHSPRVSHARPRVIRAVTLSPLPAVSRMRWRRLDVPGREEARIERMPGGWRLAGELEVSERTASPARLRNVITVDDAWWTRAATIEGDADG